MRKARFLTTTLLIAAAALFPGNIQAESNTPHKPKNIVLVTLDTFRSDHASYMDYPRNTTPFLNKLAQDGVLFKKMRTSIPFTKNSHTAIFTSKKPPGQHVPTNIYSLPPSIKQPDHSNKDTTLQEILSQEGYTTAGFTSVGMMSVFRNSFQHYNITPPDPNAPIGIKNRKQADQIVADAIQWLQESSQEDNKFIWLHFFDAHNPYKPENKYAPSPNDPGNAYMKDYWQKKQGMQFEIFTEDEAQTATQLLNQYDGEMQQIDSQLQKFYEYLSTTTDPGDTLWIIIPDHGEGLSSHSYYTHHLRLYEEQMLTPAIVIYGSKYPPHTDNCDADNTDIMPTVADIIGHRPKINDIDGTSLLQRLNGTTTTCKKTNTYGMTTVQIDMINKRDIKQPQTFNIPLTNEQIRQKQLVQQIQHVQPKILLPLKKDELQPKHLITIYNGQYKYIENIDDGPELYDLEEDPKEQTNIAKKHFRLIKQMAKQARDIIARNEKNNPQTTGKTAQPNSQEEIQHIRQLKSLGY